MFQSLRQAKLQSLALKESRHCKECNLDPLNTVNTAAASDVQDTFACFVIIIPVDKGQQICHIFCTVYVNVMLFISVDLDLLVSVTLEEIHIADIVFPNDLQIRRPLSIQLRVHNAFCISHLQKTHTSVDHLLKMI